MSEFLFGGAQSGVDRPKRSWGRGKIAAEFRDHHGQGHLREREKTPVDLGPARGRFPQEEEGEKPAVGHLALFGRAEPLLGTDETKARFQRDGGARGDEEFPSGDLTPLGVEPRRDDEALGGVWERPLRRAERHGLERIDAD